MGTYQRSHRTACAASRDDARRSEDGRSNEPARTWYRRERVFTSNGSWFFHTREGVDVGPYSCRFDAELEVGLLIAKLRQAPLVECTSVIRNHMLEAESAAGALNSPAFTSYLVEVGGVELLRRENPHEQKTTTD